MIQFGSMTINGELVLNISGHSAASADQRVNWLLEMAALWIFQEKQDMETAIEYLRGEYGRFVEDEVAQRRSNLRIVPEAKILPLPGS